MSTVTRDQVIDFLSNLPVIEIANLVKELEALGNIKEGISKAEADEMAKTLREAGAEIDIK